MQTYLPFEEAATRQINCIRVEMCWTTMRCARKVFNTETIQLGRLSLRAMFRGVGLDSGRGTRLSRHQRLSVKRLAILIVDKQKEYVVSNLVALERKFYLEI